MTEPSKTHQQEAAERAKRDEAHNAGQMQTQHQAPPAPKPQSGTETPAQPMPHSEAVKAEHNKAGEEGAPLHSINEPPDHLPQPQEAGKAIEDEQAAATEPEAQPAKASAPPPADAPPVPPPNKPEPPKTEAKADDKKKR